MKVAQLAPHAVLMTSGEMHTHTEAIRLTERQMKTQNRETVRSVADFHAGNLRAIRSNRASQQYLSPLGLNLDLFLEKQASMNQDLVMQLADNLTRFRLDVEAIIFGVDQDGAPDLIHIDGAGTVTSHADVGSVTIGIGASQANLQMMAAGYSRHAYSYYDALGVLYAAKKSAEVAPGVGRATDMVLVTRGGAETVVPGTMMALDTIYRQWATEREVSTRKATDAIAAHFASQTANLRMYEGEVATDTKPTDVPAA